MLERTIYQGYEIETWETELGYGASIDLGHRVFTLTTEAINRKQALKEAKQIIDNIVQGHRRTYQNAH
ncbi:hypothetical protein [Synechococcus sp. PCC 6312]|uniref:hypothetical protein n=1 Tax=Synechococcus sp. (strain ATCC 27167 / PCC 6312) TaxID=195253 RepID=UPI00029F08EC|nr:hypothetical protein [Synechococcus sp. PCC 6312]AFY61849.1 hypothetical protein Syn6312_2769 [Synechococcus sp. PCC 6312]